MPRLIWVFAGRTSHFCWFCHRLPWLQSFFAFIFIMIFHIKLKRILNWRLMFYLWLAPPGSKLVDLFQCPNVILILCGFVVFTTGRFVWSLALHFVLVLLFFSVLFSIVITSFGEERADLCAFRAFVCLFCMRWFLSIFSSSWCQGLAAVCDCGTPWIFLLTFCLFHEF